VSDIHNQRRDAAMQEIRRNNELARAEWLSLIASTTLLTQQFSRLNTELLSLKAMRKPKESQP
jgi:hypothetical protein